MLRAQSQHTPERKGRFASEYKRGAMNEASGGLLVHQRRPCLVRQNIYTKCKRMAWVSFVLTPSSHCLKQITSLSATSTFYLHSKGGSHGESQYRSTVLFCIFSFEFGKITVRLNFNIYVFHFLFELGKVTAHDVLPRSGTSLFKSSVSVK